MRDSLERDKSVEVVIVSSNPETLDGLQSYLNAAGVVARCASDVADCARAASANTTAFVLFPDDFGWNRVVSLLADLEARRSPALRLLVTAQPKRFEALMSESALVMPRPVWGWTILDAIRAHINAPRATPRAHRGRS